MKAETIQSADGTRLASRVYEPDSPDRGSVVIGGAMGVRQDYYASFAQWLAGQGWRVTTFDYRGSGASMPEAGLRGYKADLFDWTRDYAAAIDNAHAALPGKPLYLLGHSLGAQLPGLLNNQDKVSVIKQVNGIAGKVAYHLHKAVVLSVDGMHIRHEWWRGEKQSAKVISGGLLAKW